MAFSDISSKHKILAALNVVYSEDDLYAIIQKEKELNIVSLNGDNNKAEIKKNNLAASYSAYVSAGRTVNVLLRFLKFLLQIYIGLQTENTFVHTVKEAYKKELVLAFYIFNWRLRTTLGWWGRRPRRASRGVPRKRLCRASSKWTRSLTSSSKSRAYKPLCRVYRPSTRRTTCSACPDYIINNNTVH